MSTKIKDRVCAPPFYDESLCNGNQLQKLLRTLHRHRTVKNMRIPQPKQSLTRCSSGAAAAALSLLLQFAGCAAAALFLRLDDCATVAPFLLLQLDGSAVQLLTIQVKGSPRGVAVGELDVSFVIVVLNVDVDFEEGTLTF